MRRILFAFLIVLVLAAQAYGRDLSRRSNCGLVLIEVSDKVWNDFQVRYLDVECAPWEIGTKSRFSFTFTRTDPKHDFNKVHFIVFNPDGKIIKNARIERHSEINPNGQAVFVFSPEVIAAVIVTH
jgi:hypothetical protein